MNAPAPVATVQLRLGEAMITIPGEAAAMAYIEKLLDEQRMEFPFKKFERPALPAFGGEYHGGKYAGLTVYENDPAELILLPGEFEGPWEKAKVWAAEQGGELPTRIDQNVLFKNLKGEFKSEYYWSSEPYAGHDACAWCQTFGYGDQDCSRKGNDYRCRAVRRISIR